MQREKNKGPNKILATTFSQKHAVAKTPPVFFILILCKSIDQIQTLKITAKPSTATSTFSGMVDAKRKRGRKPKSPAPDPPIIPIPVFPDSTSTQPSRARGRPRKLPKPNEPQLSDLPNGHVAMDQDDTDMGLEGGARIVPDMDAVVKVFCVHTEPNFSLPWQRKRQFSSSSSGFVIAGRRVLTNAHSVEHYTQVKLKKRGSDTKYLATLLAVGTECDIGIYFQS